MDILSVGLLCLLHLSPIAKSLVIARLAVKKLAARYAFFSAGLGISALCQCCLISAWWWGGVASYQQVWRWTTPIQISATLGVCMESLWLLSRHFPKSRNVAIFMLLICGFVTIITALPTSMVLPGHGLLAARRHWKAAMWAFLALTRFVLTDVEPSMRHNARMHSAGILWALAGSVVGDLILSLSRAYWAQATGKVVLLAFPLAACYWWWQMRPEGEAYTPTPGPTLAELDGDLDRAHKRLIDERIPR